LEAILEQLFAQRRELSDLAEIVESIRHLGKEAEIKKEKIVETSNGLRLGGTDGYSAAIPVLVSWICGSMDKL
jgi:hypothetical protein